MTGSHCRGDTEGGKKNSRPWEVADIFNLAWSDYKQQYPALPEQWKVMKAIVSCRTEFLGGFVEQCDSCSYQRLVFKSCRNRHCPKCGSLAKARWLSARHDEVLPVSYFHLVFTLPHELNPLLLVNKRRLLDMLFRAVSETLLTFGRNPQHGLGGKLGFSAILHTWDQKMREHVHLHCLVPAGALVNDETRWVHAGPGFLFPVHALSNVFRGKYIAL